MMQYINSFGVVSQNVIAANSYAAEQAYYCDPYRKGVTLERYNGRTGKREEIFRYVRDGNTVIRTRV